MAQAQISTFFNTRKRAAGDDISHIKHKRLHDGLSEDTIDSTIASSEPPTKQIVDNVPTKTTPSTKATRARTGRTTKRSSSKVDTPSGTTKISKIEQHVKQRKLVEFIKKGPLSPRKKQQAESNEIRKFNEETPTTSTTLPINVISTKQDAAVVNVEQGMVTPTKQIIKEGSAVETATKHSEIKRLVKRELNFDEVKTKVSRSAKLQELKASLARIQELEKSRKEQEEKNRRLREGLTPTKKSPVLQLKEFDTIEVEVLTSPSKNFKTPTKLPPATPDKNELMSPRITDVSKRMLFSPSKDGSPSKLIQPPAYQRFQTLAQTSKAGQLPLPFKYRHLVEIFRGVDSVCAMFHNRKECITFKKLKPAVQRMLRKNFTEMHLAQIKQIFPDAFIFSQMKMRNYGSTSKADYFQLVIKPNVDNIPEKHKLVKKIDEDNVLASAQTNAMNPQVMTERMQIFQRLLLERVKTAHDKFLKSLDPPLSIPKEKVTRWHPDFDLETCPAIECAHLPQPPNVEKYSSAHDILSTARNLFNCATPMERAMERYEANMEAKRMAAVEVESNKMTANPVNDSKTTTTTAPSTPTSTATTATTTQTPNDVATSLLKGVPKSLLERIRAKQAAKALDAITRRPSQDQEAVQYTRLPEMARHLRNVFITERKGVLPLETIIKKIQNSFRTCLTPQEIETHLKLITKEVPVWASFHEVRKTMYLKISKDMDLSKVIEKLEAAANEKSK